MVPVHEPRRRGRGAHPRSRRARPRPERLTIDAEPWSVEDRLARARARLSRRQPAHPALRSATEDGALPPRSEARVDSFLSSLNSSRADDAYAPFLETAVTVEPLAEVGTVEVTLASSSPDVDELELDGDGLGPGPTQTVARRLVPGSQHHVARSRGRGYTGRPTRVTVTWDHHLPWPDGVEVAVDDPGRLVVSPTPFRPEATDHPAIREIATGLGAGAVVEAATSDVEAAIALRQWIKAHWDHEVPRRPPPYDGRLIIDRARRGVDTFICMHYSVALVHACASVGMAARVVNLHRNVVAGSDYVLGAEAAHDPPIDEHVTTEVFSRELGHWVMMDPDFDCHYERDGRAVSAWELHEALLDQRLDGLEVRRGPGAAAHRPRGEDFYEAVLPGYYRHVSILMRSDFISDPDGPVPVLHLTDEATPPILWHDGEDLRLHPDLMGPLVVGRLHDGRTGLLTDGSLEAAWASSDEPVPHTVELAFDHPRRVVAVGLSWPQHRGVFATSRAYEVVGRLEDGGRVGLASVTGQTERPASLHRIEPQRLVAVEVVQMPGSGSIAHPDRLWLSQVEVVDAEPPLAGP